MRIGFPIPSFCLICRYYLMPEKTEEEFTSYAHARRWFKTGDIGEFQGRKMIHICLLHLGRQWNNQMVVNKLLLLTGLGKLLLKCI